MFPRSLSIFLLSSSLSQFTLSSFPISFASLSFSQRFFSFTTPNSRLFLCICTLFKFFSRFLIVHFWPWLTRTGFQLPHLSYSPSSSKACVFSSFETDLSSWYLFFFYTIIIFLQNIVFKSHCFTSISIMKGSFLITRSFCKFFVRSDCSWLQKNTLVFTIFFLTTCYN